SPEGSNFYVPIIADPANAGTIFEGSQSVWRTQDWGGDQAYLEANCPEFTTSGTQPGCGDFVRIGPSGATDLTAAGYGTRAGGAGDLADLPVTDRVRDDMTGDLYASSDFGVMRLPNATTTWVIAGSGLPQVEVAGLTIVPGARKLYAATHGRSGWSLQLP